MNTTYFRTLDVIERHLQAMIADLRHVAVADGEGSEWYGDVPGGDNGAAVPTDWQEVARLTSQTYSWPPDNGGEEEYDPFVIWASETLSLALAQNVRPTWVKERERKQVWVFQCEHDGSHKRPISPFIGTDDYEGTRDLIAIIRGNGESGRGMFSPGTELPAPYDRLRIEILGDRVDGHYNKLAVVAHEDDTESMLLHGAAQIKMRGW